jgi:hypothetical protein
MAARTFHQLLNAYLPGARLLVRSVVASWRKRRRRRA